MEEVQEAIGLICTIIGAATLAWLFVKLVEWMEKPHKKKVVK